MCLIVFAYDHHPDYELIFAANRDEFYDRPTAPARFWEEQPKILAGRDLKAGGTWMGTTRAGRIAAVTNVRDPDGHRDDAPSRGMLVTDYLNGNRTPEDHATRLAGRAERYNGFNLLVGNLKTLWYCSNRDGASQQITPGIHGLSNHRLDTEWPKVKRAKGEIDLLIQKEELTPESLFELLADRTRPPEEDLPDTGVPEEWERVLAPIFIASPSYGTRSSTVLLIRRDGQVTFAERSFEAGGEPAGTEHHTFEVD